MLWRGGEQVLANVLHIAELARQYEAEGGLSFRGFVESCASRRRSRAGAGGADPRGRQRRRAPDDRAQGQGSRVSGRDSRGHHLRLSRDDAPRYLDSERGLCAIRLAGWAPLDLSRTTSARPPRSCRGRAARLRRRHPRTRSARGSSHRRCAVRRMAGSSPLNDALYPPIEPAVSSAAAGVPEFKSKEPCSSGRHGETPRTATVRPGAYAMPDATTGEGYTVVWWDPLRASTRGDERARLATRRSDRQGRACRGRRGRSRAV